MMNSEELEVLKVLYRHNNEEDATTEYSLTNRKFVKAISQTITDVIYDSYKNKSLSSRNTRQTFIELLKTWIEPNSHFLIDDSNYNIIVKSLIKEPSPAENFYNKHGKDFIQLCQKSSQINVKNNLETISDIISKKYTSSLENKIKSDLIQTWQKSQFEKINFDFSLSNKNYQNSDVESLIEYLRNIQIKSSPIEKINQFTDKLESKQSFNNQESSIELGYALLNFEKSADNEKLLLKILEKIFCAKSEDGVKLVDHIWKNQVNLNLSSNTYLTTLKYFPHVYEKPLITLAKEILENLDTESVDYEYEILIQQSKIKNILEICDFDLELYNNIILVINKLLFLSKFDVRIFKMLKIIERFCRDE